MAYSGAELHEIARDPVRLRGYFWRVATNAHRMALQARAASKTMATQTRMNNYQYAYDEGRDLVAEADHLESFSQMILDNIDILVENSLEK